MDDIQKELIKAGRKDLAQEYYKKVASTSVLDDALDLTLFNFHISPDRTSIALHFRDTSVNVGGKKKVVNIYSSKEIVID